MVAYLPERISFTDPDEALRFVEMLCDGRVELEIVRGLLWTTMRSYRDGQTLSRSGAPACRGRRCDRAPNGAGSAVGRRSRVA